MATHQFRSRRRAAPERIPRLFRLRRRGQIIIELPIRTVAMERSLQRLVEGHLLQLLDVQYVASEYPIGAQRKGRIDTLGLDRNGAPVVIEYKRRRSVNIISQGLFYLDWLDEHRGEFRLLVHEHYGPDAAAAIRWSDTRLICIAAEFHRYNLHAGGQVKRRIELLRYHWFGDDLLFLAIVDVAA